MTDQLQALLDASHGGEVVRFHGLVIGAGVHHGGVELLVPQELLDAGHRAAGVQELRGSGMAQAMRVHLHSHPLPGISNPGARQVFLELLVAVQEDMIRGPLTPRGQVVCQCPHGGIGHVHVAVFHALAVADRELASGQVQVFQAQLFQLTQPQPALPEQVEDGPVQQRIPHLVGLFSPADPPLEIVAQRSHLIVGQVLGQSLGLLETRDVQERAQARA